MVSTHSRPKAAGWRGWRCSGVKGSFNTQPPEGGWPCTMPRIFLPEPFQHTAARRRLAEDRPRRESREGFNTQPPEGGWIVSPKCRNSVTVSTHSRPKAAGITVQIIPGRKLVSTHSRPKAAGPANLIRSVVYGSFNTQPPEGGWQNQKPQSGLRGRFNTQPPEGGWKSLYVIGAYLIEFQHTAARRRLVPPCCGWFSRRCVSTHSRPKAAGRCCMIAITC